MPRVLVWQAAHAARGERFIRARRDSPGGKLETCAVRAPWGVSGTAWRCFRGARDSVRALTCDYGGISHGAHARTLARLCAGRGLWELQSDLLPRAPHDATFAVGAAAARFYLQPEAPRTPMPPILTVACSTGALRHGLPRKDAQLLRRRPRIGRPVWYDPADVGRSRQRGAFRQADARRRIARARGTLADIPVPRSAQLPDLAQRGGAKCCSGF